MAMLVRMISCLIVDDDPALCRLVGDHLARYGLIARLAGSARAMRQELRRGGVDLVLLDLALPDADGFELLRELRRHSRLPLMVLSASGDPVSRVLGLEMGADDYVAKPFDPRELVARIHALARRSTGALAAARPERIDPGAMPVSRGFAGWQVDWRHRVLISPDNVSLALSNAEYRLLVAFAERPGEVLSRGELVALTRGPAGEGAERGIDLAVSRLRAKLRESPDNPRFISTVRGRGYRFQPELRS